MVASASAFGLCKGYAEIALMNQIQQIEFPHRTAVSKLWCRTKTLGNHHFYPTRRISLGFQPYYSVSFSRGQVDLTKDRI